MHGDPFSDFLGLMEARSVLSGGFAVSGAWALHFPPPEEIKFCVVARGECSFWLDGETEIVQAQAGDVALLPGRSGFTVASRWPALPTPPTEAARFFAEKTMRFPQFGDGSEFLALAGGVSLRSPSAALLTDALPPIIHVRGSSPRAAPLRWIIKGIPEGWSRYEQGRRGPRGRTRGCSGPTAPSARAGCARATRWTSP